MDGEVTTVTTTTAVATVTAVATTEAGAKITTAECIMEGKSFLNSDPDNVLANSWATVESNVTACQTRCWCVWGCFHFTSGCGNVLDFGTSSSLSPFVPSPMQPAPKSPHKNLSKPHERYPTRVASRQSMTASRLPALAFPSTQSYRTRTHLL